MRAKAILLALFVVLLAICAGATTYNTLYSFDAMVNSPFANLTLDQHGNLYGVAAYGDNCDGEIFRLSVSSDWNYERVYCFDIYDYDAREPLAAVVFDEAGNLYGTASYTSSSGCGAIFKFSPFNGYSILHYFTGTDGCTPQSNLSYRAGRLWGTTSAGGSSAQGAVFSLKTSGDPIDVYSFKALNGKSPLGSINVWNYGTTNAGGRNGAGNIYQLDARNRLVSKFSFALSGRAGYSPMGDLLTMYRGDVRTMYGATSSGGRYGGGTLYQLTELEPNSERWRLRVLHSFSMRDGQKPLAGVAADAAGNLYGTTSEGGDWNCGTVFKLSPGINDSWNYRVIYSFHSDGGANLDGCQPSSSVVVDNVGNLYGTTVNGGWYGQGTVYQIIP